MSDEVNTQVDSAAGTGAPSEPQPSSEPSDSSLPPTQATAPEPSAPSSSVPSEGAAPVATTD